MMQPPVKLSNVEDFITSNSTFLVTVDGERFYEFRDLTPRDLLWIDGLNEADNLDYKNYIDSLEFLILLSKRLIICSNFELDNEDWQIFLDISKRVQESVLSQCIPWKNFLELVFACGNKSFTTINEMMDMSLTQVMDLQTTLINYYEAQKAAMDEAQGIRR